MFIVSEEWKAAYPGAAAGILVMHDVANPASHPEIDGLRTELESQLRSRFAGGDRSALAALQPIQAYNTYFKRYGKTYHVQLQLESIVLKGKNLPDVSPLVDANFMAEAETFLLSAGHDAAKLVEPVVMDISHEGESMTQMNGTPKIIRTGDMIMRDAEGLACSILYGQDNRSHISLDTSHVLYVAYAPPGVPAQAVEAHLRRIEDNVRLFSKSAVLEQLRLLTTESG